MRIPERPPNLDAVMRQTPAQELVALIGKRHAVDDQGRYLHWDEFRRKPPPPGLTIEKAWFATRTARAAAAERLSLRNVKGQAFSFNEPPRLRATLRYIDLHAGGVLGTDRTSLSPTDGSRYFRRSLAEEPFASSFIEGAATTRQRAKQLIFDQRAPRTKDEIMVLNNYRGMEYVKTLVAAPLTVENILETHRIITADTLDDPRSAGSLRTTDEVVVVDDSDGSILHQPPPYAQLEQRLAELCAFANAEDDGENYVHPIIRAIILHFMLAYEHPFVDGNGRTARALFYWSALRSGYWLIEYASISAIIAEAKLAYGRAFLYTETDADDLTYFLMHQAYVLRAAIERLFEYAERRKREVETLQSKVVDEQTGEFNRRQSFLLNDAARQRLKRITIKEYEAQHKVSYLTARADLEELVALGLLRKRKEGRQNVFTPAPNIVGLLTSRA